MSSSTDRSGQRLKKLVDLFAGNDRGAGRLGIRTARERRPLAAAFAGFIGVAIAALVAFVCNGILVARKGGAGSGGWTVLSILQAIVWAGVFGSFGR